MSNYYTDLSQLFIAGSIQPTAILIHMTILFTSVVLSAYGLTGFVRYDKHLSKNWHLLALAFGLLTLMPLSEILELLKITPGEGFWHHLHIFAGFIAFYFIYKFAILAHAKKQDSVSKSIVIVLSLLALAGIYGYAEPLIENEQMFLIVMVYIVMLTIQVFFIVLLFDIMEKMNVMDLSFSLKSLTIAAIPIISIILLIMNICMIFPEFFYDVFHMQSHPAIVFLVALQNIFYLVLATTLTSFTFIGKKMHGFYGPFEHFVDEKTKR